MADTTEAEDMIAAAAAAIAGARFNPTEIGQFAVVPKGFVIESLEAYQLKATRIVAAHTFADVGSLAEYLNRFANDWTMIAADAKRGMIRAQVDGDEPVTGSHKTHSASFEAQVGDKLKAWLGICGKPLTQVEFGLFLEDRSVDVVVPEAADIMDMVMQFDATKKVVFKQATRLHDGSRQLTYTEDNDQTKGAMRLPESITIFAPVYRGMEPERIRFLLRYRIEEGRLRFTVGMHDKDEVMRAAFDRCVDALRVSVKRELPIYMIA
jgi:uncharacterized protein YfdQ (DUF2303 family)